MAGIKSYGVHIPKYRLDRSVMQAAILFLGYSQLTGEKAVANWDEDSTTMAVEAAMSCLNGRDRKTVDALYYATTTQTYSLRQNAGIIGTALDLKDNIRTADFTASSKSGAAALLAAADAVDSGSLSNCVVTAADCRISKVASIGDYSYGDAAAAVLIGSDDVIATIDGSYSTSHDFVDRRRLASERYERILEERFIREEGYKKHIPEAINGLLKKYKLQLKDFTKIVFACGFPRMHSAVAKTMGLSPEQVQDPLLTMVGDCGVAHPLLMLAGALEEAGAGDKIMVVGFGQGCDALFLTVTDKIADYKNEKGLDKSLADKAAMTSYEKYLAFRKLMPVEVGIRGEEINFTSFNVISRASREILGMVGSQCKKCDAPYFPLQRICANSKCGAIDEMETYRFSDKKGVIFTYTTDYMAATTDPPISYGYVDFEEGGRVLMEFTDCDYTTLKVGLPIELTFRIKVDDPARGAVNYGWKGIPQTKSSE